MFRKMRRFKQQMTDEACKDVLRDEKRGVLSVIGDDGYPYGIPIDYWYCDEDGKIYFHGAKEGHKIDAVRACDKVSFTVIDEGVREGEDWPLHFQSVIVFGRIREVEDYDKAMVICRNLLLKFTDDEAEIEHEIEKSGPHVLCLELTPEHMTGKRVKES